MKKLIVLMGLMLSASAFAADCCSGSNTSTITPTATSTSVASPTAIAGTNTGANTQNITFAGSDNTEAAKIAAQAAVDVANTTQTIRNTPSVSGPALTSSNDTCMGSTSGSVNIAGLGIGGGSSWVDANCKMLKNSREMWNMGMRGASLALMCTDASNRDALELTGFECPQTVRERKNSEQLKMSNSLGHSTPVPYEPTDPIIRSRLGLPALK